MLVKNLFNWASLRSYNNNDMVSKHMQKFLRNLSIGRFLTLALSSMALSVALLAALSFYLMGAAHTDTVLINRVGVDQSNSILTANINRLRARTKLGIYFDSPEKRSLLSASDYTMRADEIANHIKLAQEDLDRFSKVTDEDVEAKYVRDVVEVYRPALVMLEKQVQAVRDKDWKAYEDAIQEQQKGTKDLELKVKDYITFTTDYADSLINQFQRNYTLFWGLALVLLIISAAVFVIARANIKKHILSPLSEALEHLQHMSKADLSRAISSHSKNEVGQLIDAMVETQDKLREIVHSVRSGSSLIFAGADEISIGNSDLSARTEQQAASLEETASSMEEMTATVKQNADNSRNASGLAREASNTVDRGKEVVVRVVGTMNGIADSSQKISHIISVIDSIAFQTNILALNASVEAARAGEQGRGFAVVANEVRSLAGKSADAAREIKALIQDSTARVNEGSKLVEEAGSTMDEMVSAVSRVTDIIDEITAASREQSEGIGQINEAVAQMDQVTQQNASLVQQAASASASLREEAHRLEQEVSVFNLGGEQQRAKKSPARTPSAPVKARAVVERQPAAPKVDEWSSF